MGRNYVQFCNRPRSKLKTAVTSFGRKRIFVYAEETNSCP